MSENLFGSISSWSQTDFMLALDGDRQKIHLKSPHDDKSLMLFNHKASIDHLGRSYEQFISEQRSLSIFITFAEKFISKNIVEFLTAFNDTKKINHLEETTQDEKFSELWKNYCSDPQTLDIADDTLTKEYSLENLEKINKMIHLKLSKLYYKKFLSSVAFHEYLQAQRKENAPSKTIDDLIRKPIELKVFKLFAKKEYALENVEFIEILRNFQNEKDPIKSEHVADGIVKDFVLEDSVHYLNITEKVKIQCLEMHKRKDRSRFDSVESEVIRIMRDMFSRFVVDDIWLNYIADLEKSRGFSSFYRLHSLVELGNVCEIYLGYSIKTNNEYRIVKKFYDTKEALEQDYIRCLLKVKHASLVSIEEVFRDVSNLHLYIILPNLTETLGTYMLSNESIFRTISIDQLIDFYCQLVYAVHDLELMGILCEIGELYEENIYMSNLFTSLFIDQKLYGEKLSSLKLEENPSEKTDVYQLGMVFYKMIHLDSTELDQKKFLSTFKSKEIGILVSSMIDPSKRPSIKKVKTKLLKLQIKTQKKNIVDVHVCMRNEKLCKIFKKYCEKEENFDISLVEEVYGFSKITDFSAKMENCKKMLELVEKINLNESAKRYIVALADYESKSTEIRPYCFDFIIAELVSKDLGQFWDDFIQNKVETDKFKKIVGNAVFISTEKSFM